MFATLPAHARQMTMMATSLGAQEIHSGRGQQFFVRFDGPVDHQGARLDVLRGDEVVASLHALLDSAPNVLFAQMPALSAGDYVLRWSVRSLPDREVTEGTVPFSVRK